MNKGEVAELIRANEYKVPFKVWEFTPLDRACLKMVIRGTWIFETQLDVGLMKEALAKTLSYYPHLAGRMSSQAGVTLTNEGVRFVSSAEPELTVEEVLERNDANNISNFSVGINAGRFSKGLDSPLSVKVTRLKNGTVLGVQCSHACMDGDSFYTLVYNWGQICRNEAFDIPLLDQSLLPVAEDLPVAEIRAAALEAGWQQLSIFSIFRLLPAVLSGVIKKRSTPFWVSAETITRLKELVLKTTGIQGSTNLVLAAFITKRCLELYKHQQNTRCSFVTVVNTRKRLAGIPLNYAGNSSLSIATPAFAAGTSFAEIAAMIEETLKPVRQSPSLKLMALMKLNLNSMKYKLPFAPFDVFGMYARKPTTIYLNNFSKLHIYDINFGSGEPVRVIPHDLGDQIVIWPAPPDKGGVAVYFTGIPTLYLRGLQDDYFNSL
ncbi:MAG: hypothetical protein FJ152_06830 [Firmicutes bacterium]|nr:hypothetical protein [Bacillota bacterium]